MAPACRHLFVVASVVLIIGISLNVYFFEKSLASPTWREDDRAIALHGGPLQDGRTNVTNVFGRSISYITPPLRECMTLPIGVLSGYAARRQEVRETWGKNKSSCVYFMVGKENGAWPEEEFRQEGDLVLLDMDEIYSGSNSSLPYKTWLWFYLAHQWFPEAMHVLKTDDDSYVYVDGLEAELTLARPDYWGSVHRAGKPFRDPTHKWYVSKSVWSEDVYPDYCNGGGYVLSRKALGCLLSKVKTQAYIPSEDVSIGAAMQTCRIEPNAHSID